MKAFLIGLQFLTRIQVVKQTVWTEEDFGKSVRYFPLVGLVLGLLYGFLAWLLTWGLEDIVGISVPEHFRAAILALVPFLATGGIHCDGFMDTVDGIFSGRERDRMLEIMKDSRTGSFGVVAFGILVLMQYSLLLDMPKENLPWALLVMPVVGRLMMTGAISLFPYARPDGMGKAFGKYATSKNYIFIVIYTLLLLAILDGWFSLAAVAAGYVFLYLFGRYVTKLLGGLTGDVYGAVCTLTELLTLAVYLFV
ncbi:MAG: adenosylcobinamide-GDP ribazoletransferase [Anaerovibrio sp.]|nr:adenosylcobinamide-GDP ribazoletransferase [Anaerovibrio sp.]